MVKPTKRRRRSTRRKGFVAIPFTAQMSLATLADAIVIAQNLLSATFGEDIFIISIDWIASIRNLTGGEVPLSLGLAHSDLSVTELAEGLDAEVTDPDDIIAKERARRPVRRLGVFSGNVGDITLNDGRVTRTKVLLQVGDGHSLNVWIRNQSGSTLTTGAELEIGGTIFGRWMR